MLGNEQFPKLDAHTHTLLTNNSAPARKVAFILTLLSSGKMSSSSLNLEIEPTPLPLELIIE